MARSDLLVALVKAGNTGDRRGVRVATEAIIAEERAKQHGVLADRLARVLQANPSAPHALPVTDASARGRDFISERIPRRRLGDLILPPTCLDGINQLIEEQNRADLLRAQGMEPRHRILLVGPPGTGKTSLAEAIAEAIAVPLLVVRYESMIGSYLGETAARLKRVFDYARTTPCVLFFDEFDALGKERGDVHETGEIKRVVTSLLMQMDELPSYTIIAAATNHPELLDRAAWRRFQLRLELPLPTVKELAEYIEVFAETIDQPLGQTAIRIAKQLGEISYAEVEEFCMDVRRRYVLAVGEKSVKTIIQEQLAIWAKQARSESATTKN